MADLQKSIWIDAPPDVVFDYFVEPEKMIRWAGLQAELDPVPGGIYRLDMGVAGVIQGQFVKVDPGKYVSFEVNPPEGAKGPPSTIEITIAEEAAGSRVEVRHTGLEAPFDAIASRGWDHHLARLSVIAQGGTAVEDSLCKRPLESLAG